MLIIIIDWNVWNDQTNKKTNHAKWIGSKRKESKRDKDADRLPVTKIAWVNEKKKRNKNNSEASFWIKAVSNNEIFRILINEL